MIAESYFRGEEVEVLLQELVLIDKYVVDSGRRLTKETCFTSPFELPVPKGKLAAYWGAFGEYVPVKIPQGEYCNTPGCRSDDREPSTLSALGGVDLDDLAEQLNTHSSSDLKPSM